MIRPSSSRRLAMLAALTLAGVGAAGAQAPQTPQVPAPPAAGRAAALVLLPPPALAPAPARRPLRSVASVAPSPLAALAPAPRTTPPPDSIVRGRTRVSLATPAPLVRETPRPRVRNFGAVRTDVARQPAPAGATGRCKDGTYLTTPPTEDACAGKGGLTVRVPPPHAAPPAPARRP